MRGALCGQQFASAENTFIIFSLFLTEVLSVVERAKTFEWLAKSSAAAASSLLNGVSYISVRQPIG